MNPLFGLPLLVGIILASFLGLIVWILIAKWFPGRRTLHILFLASFLIQLVVVGFLYYAEFQPFSNGRGDYQDYHAQAVEIAGRIRAGNFSFEGIETSNHSYALMVGIIYAVTIPNMFMGQIFNAWLTALVVVMVYLVCKEIGSQNTPALMTAGLVNFYPSLAFFGGLLLRESVVALLALFGLLLTIKMAKHFTWTMFLAFYVSLALLVHFRFYAGYAMLLAFVACWFLVATFPWKKKLLYFVIMIPLLGFLPQISGQGYYGYKMFQFFFTGEMITYYRESAYANNTPNDPPSLQRPGRRNDPINKINVDSTVVVESGLGDKTDFAKNSATAFVTTLFGPFPWQMSKAKHAVALIETIPWYVLCYFIIRGSIGAYKERNRAVIPLLVFSLIFLGVISLYLASSFGIFTRIRIPVFLSLLCIASLGLKNITLPFTILWPKYIQKF